ncbi:MAG: glycosyltransferase [Solirubrobacterales bacterium]
MTEISPPRAVTDDSRPALPGRFHVSVCVCTRNRPDELAKCIASITASELPAHEIIVSDDSDDGFAGATRAAAAGSALYTRGPRRGLCANRNNAIAQVTGDHLLFLDDDARLARDFLSRVRECLDSETTGDPGKTIVTGRERRPGRALTAAREQSFLGFQELGYDGDDRYSTVVINAAVFPRGLFTQIGFDERLRYGYDEVDLTTRALALGYRIVARPEAVNDHFPSPVNRGEYSAVTDASRLYVTAKRYAVTERTRLRVAAFALVAPLHLLAAAVKSSGFRGVARWGATLKLTLSHLRAGLGGATARPPLKER